MFTYVVPTAKTLFLGGLQVITPIVPMGSSAEMSHVTVAEDVPCAGSALTDAGQIISGAVTSRIVTPNVHEATLLSGAVAVQTTCVAVELQVNWLLERGLHTMLVMGTPPLLALTLKYFEFQKKEKKKS